MKKHIEERFQRVWDRFTADEKTRLKAEKTFEDYKEGANAFRGALSDQAMRLLPREEYNLHHTALVEKVDSIDARVLQNTALQVGRTSGISSVGYIAISLITSLGVLASLAISLLHH